MSVADELEIRQLVARYAEAVGTRDEKQWAETWADDGEWIVIGTPAKGREACVELWKRLMGGLPFVVQMATGGIITVEGDRGTGRWAMQEFGRTADGSGMMNIGLYRDEYVKVDGAWRFARRRFDPMYIGPPDLSAEPRALPEDV